MTVGTCNVPTINQATITPQQKQVSIGQQITVTCAGNLFINGGTNRAITLYCVTGGFSTIATGQPQTLPKCANQSGMLNKLKKIFLRNTILMAI